jgi:hypothetical protein
MKLLIHFSKLVVVVVHYWVSLSQLLSKLVVVVVHDWLRRHLTQPTRQITRQPSHARRYNLPVLPMVHHRHRPAPQHH